MLGNPLTQGRPQPRVLSDLGYPLTCSACTEAQHRADRWVRQGCQSMHADCKPGLSDSHSPATGCRGAHRVQGTCCIHTRTR